MRSYLAKKLFNPHSDQNKQKRESSDPMYYVNLRSDSDAFKQIMTNPLSYKVIMDRLNSKANISRLSS